MQKEKRVKSKRHVDWVRSRPCAAQSLSCSGINQAHHLLSPWIGSRGMGMKADDRNVIPLCRFHHEQLHIKYGTEDRFFHIHGRPEGFAKEVSRYLWEQSPFYSPE